MKLNNKGITLVEVIVTFGLLMIILVGLFNIILDVKSDISDRQIRKELKDFDNIMISKIQGDFIKYGVKSCNDGECLFKDNSTKVLSINGKNINYDGNIYTLPNDDVVIMHSSNSIDTITDELNGNVKYIVFTFKYNISGIENEEFGFVIKQPVSS